MPKLAKKDRELFEKRRQRKRLIAEAFAGLSPEEKLGYIPVAGVPPTEFEIQSFIYEGLKSLGYTVRGEVKSRCDTCIFDIVVYEGDRPIRIIEVKKSRGGGSRSFRKRTRKMRSAQVEKYEKFGIPVDLVCTLKNAKEYVANFLKV